MSLKCCPGLDAHKLRKDHRIVGNYVGALPCKPRQDIWLGLPFELMPEETTLLLEQGGDCAYTLGDCFIRVFPKANFCIAI